VDWPEAMLESYLSSSDRPGTAPESYPSSSGGPGTAPGSGHAGQERTETERPEHCRSSQRGPQGDGRVASCAALCPPALPAGGCSAESPAEAEAAGTKVEPVCPTPGYSCQAPAAALGNGDDSAALSGWYRVVLDGVEVGYDVRLGGVIRIEGARVWSTLDRPTVKESCGQGASSGSKAPVCVEHAR
jgi:hypothetical protein